ncbi:MAG: hypothetical protein KDH88_01595 [Chromatiales bacterium]|nr:hypothetical protein [Chromatiales bacterium]
MILTSEFWYDVVPRRPNKDRVICGKWLYFGETTTFYPLLKELNVLVEEGKVLAAKVSRKVPGVELFPEKPCVLCVFTSDLTSEKEIVRALIDEKFGISSVGWKSEESTEMDWGEDGWLNIQSQINIIKNELTSDRVDVSKKNKELEVLVKKLEDVFYRASYDDRQAELIYSTLFEIRNLLNSENYGELSKTISRNIEDLRSKLDTIAGIEYGGTFRVSNNNYAFIIMPFVAGCFDTYETIKRVTVGILKDWMVDRVDERISSFPIISEVQNSIIKSSLIICDLSKERQNVYYELGFAHGLKKDVICIAEEGTKIHFDLSGYKINYFQDSNSLESILKMELINYIKNKNFSDA